MKAINVPTNCFGKTPIERVPFSSEYHERGNFIYIARA